MILLPYAAGLTCSDDEPTTTIENTRSGTTPTPPPTPGFWGSTVGIKKYENMDPPVSGTESGQLCVAMLDSKDGTSVIEVDEKYPFIADMLSFPISAVRVSTVRP